MDYEMILRYVEVLIWPLFLLGIIVFNRREARILIGRIAQSSRIKTPVFEADIGEIAVKGDEPEDQQDLAGVLSYSAILAQSRGFFEQDLMERKRRASVMFAESSQISKEQLDMLVLSDNDEHQLAGLIALNSKIRNNQIQIDSEAYYKKFVSSSLNHPNSLIRFRAVELIKVNSVLIPDFKDILEDMQSNESSNAVKMLIRFAIKNVES